MSTRIENLIDKTLKEIWENEIQNDYKNRWLLKEDTLKNSMYYHLRTRLGDLFEENNIRIFTEFTDDVFDGKNFRPDIVIAEMDFNRKSEYFGHDVKRCLAVIELKYKNNSTPAKVIYDDYVKLHKYVDKLKLKCKLYMATIWEHEDDATSWELEDSDWAKNVLTELNASHENGQMRFYVYEHKEKENNYDKI